MLQEDIGPLLKNPLGCLKMLTQWRKYVKFYRHYDEIFITQAYGWLYNHLKPNTTLLDLGAFIGDTPSRSCHESQREGGVCL